MFSERTQYALDHFLKSDLFLSTSTHYDLQEKDPQGRSILHVTIAGDNLCIEELDKKACCTFVSENFKDGMKKQSDHLIFEYVGNQWILHIIEMKTTVDKDEWVSIRYKTRSSYLTALSIAVFLGIEVSAVHAYTTYEKEKFYSINQPTKPVLYKAKLGERKVDYKKDEWDAGRIVLNIHDSVIVPHTAIHMTRNEDGVLEGNFDLSASLST